MLIGKYEGPKQKFRPFEKTAESGNARAASAYFVGSDEGGTMPFKRM